MNQRAKTALIMLLLFIASWLPRVLALDTFVTTDERKWLARSANFTLALTQGDFANTFQREHPGVTVMWAGTLGFLTHFPTYPQEAPGYFGWSNEEIETWLHGQYQPHAVGTAGGRALVDRAGRVAAHRSGLFALAPAAGRAGCCPGRALCGLDALGRGPFAPVASRRLCLQPHLCGAGFLSGLALRWP